MAPNCNSLETASALWAIRDQARFRLANATRTAAVAGGNGRLVEALGRQAKARLHLQAVLVAVRAGADEVVATVRSKGRQEQLRAARLVISAPFAALRGVRFDPALPEGKARAIRELPYAQISKLYLQTKTRYYETLGLHGTLWTDTPIERVFVSTPRDSESPRGLLHVWIDGDGATRVDAMPEHERVPFVLSHLERVLPGTLANVEAAAYHSWGQDPFAGDAYCHFAPGQVAALHPHIAPAAGHIHFAGEHTTTVEPGMEAALESGQRVAEEIARLAPRVARA